MGSTTWSLLVLAGGSWRRGLRNRGRNLPRNLPRNQPRSLARNLVRNQERNQGRNLGRSLARSLARNPARSQLEAPASPKEAATFCRPRARLRTRLGSSLARAAKSLLNYNCCVIGIEIRPDFVLSNKLI